MKTSLMTLLLIIGCSLFAQNEIEVVIREFNPCVKNASAKPSGFDIEIWEAVAKEANIRFRYTAKDSFQEMIDAIKDPAGTSEVALSGISMYSSREAQMDFSYPYKDVTLAIAVPHQQKTSRLIEFRALRGLWNSLCSIVVAEFAVCLLILVIIFAHITWLTEKGEDAFNDNYFPGIFESIWYVIVTFSTVGYGDFTPRKWLGRCAALIMIFVGIAFFCNFTALLSADYTSEKLGDSITGLEDLKDKLVVTKKGSTGSAFLSEKGIQHYDVETTEEMYSEVINGDADALLFDSPNVEYHANYTYKGDIDVIDLGLAKQTYGIALRTNCASRDKINTALLKIKENGTYDKIHFKWFGK